MARTGLTGTAARHIAQMVKGSVMSMSDADRCICCGEIIPEGVQTCPNCNAKVYPGRTQLPDRWLMRDVPKRPHVYKMRIGYGYKCWQCGHGVSYGAHDYCPKCGQRQDWPAVWLHEKEILNGRESE